MSPKPDFWQDFLINKNAKNREFKARTVYKNEKSASPHFWTKDLTDFKATKNSRIEDVEDFRKNANLFLKKIILN